MAKVTFVTQRGDKTVRCTSEIYMVEHTGLYSSEFLIFDGTEFNWISSSQCEPIDGDYREQVIYSASE